MTASDVLKTEGEVKKKFSDSSEGESKDEPRKFMSASRAKKKACRFCTDDDFFLDYKNVRVLQTFLTEHGKIVPNRISGTCATHQRALTRAIKRARGLALVGYTSAGF